MVAIARHSRLRSVFLPHRIVISILLAVAAGLLWLAVTESRDGTETIITRPTPILRVFPVEGGLGLRQEPVGFVLQRDHTGELVIDGAFIPLDQLVRPNEPAAGDNAPVNQGLAGLNQFSFTPGEEKEIEELAPGTHTATVRYWLRATQTREQAQTYTWTFRVS